MNITDEMPLGELRACTERRLEDFAEAIGCDPETIWQTALTAQSIPRAFEQSDEGEHFWECFTKLREVEAATVSERLVRWVR